MAVDADSAFQSSYALALTSTTKPYGAPMRLVLTRTPSYPFHLCASLQGWPSQKLPPLKYAAQREREKSSSL